MGQVDSAVQSTSDLKASFALVGTGAGGSFAQAITEWSNMVVAGGNALLVLGGLYLLWYKIKNTRRRDRRAEDKHYLDQ